MKISQSRTKTMLSLLLAVALSTTITAVTTVPVAANPPQKTSNSAAVSAKKQGKIKAAKEGKAKAAARKRLTGRDHQGNHDSLTKPNKSGAKGDKHAEGIKQAGAAGSKKKK
jgi:hypothetical protein